MNPPRKTQSSRGTPDKEAAQLSLDYDHLSRLCLKYWKWLVGGVILGAVAGYLYSYSQTPIYSAQATIEVNSKNNNPDGSAIGQPDGISDDMIKTFEQLLQTKDLAEIVVKSVHLNDDPDFMPEGVAPPISEDDATGMLAGDFSIQNRLGTRLIDISVEHRSPQMAQYLANQLAQASITQEFNQHTQGTTVLSVYLQKEADRLKDQLATAESALKSYEASHNMVGTGDDPETSVDQHIADLNKEYSDAQAQVTLLQERYGPEHPKLIAAVALVDELHNELEKSQADAVKSSDQNSGYSTLKSDVDSDQAQLDSTQKQLQAALASAHVEIPGISVVEQATLPYAPIRPNKIKTTAMGGFVGLICGLGFIIALYFMDSSVRTVAQAENVLGLPVIAAVPIVTDTEGRSVLPTFSDPQSFVAESFRGLRASLILQDREKPLKTILVVSAIPGEGKSFCAANLAVAFSQAGLKTLLIDADLRLPTLHTYFNLPPDQENNGFLDVLAGHATLASAVIASPIAALELLLTTTAADSPAELLSGARLPLLLDEAAQIYDRIVIDSAPLNAVSDTMLIMQKADAILLVVRAAQTPASETKAAVQKISSSNMKPLGLILNYLAAHTLKSYAYGYSYGQKPKDKNAK
jgi:succinoglycan biosynthesis transport protein ExoP